jgi:predicted peptidase
MRFLVGLLVILLAACAGAAQESPSGEPSVDASVPAEPSVAASVDAAPSPSALAPSVGVAPRPLGSMDGAPMGYLEHLPADYGTGEAMPLLVFLHGAGEAGDGSAEALALVDDLGIPQLIAEGQWPDDRPFVVLAPQYATQYADGECNFADDLAAFLEFATQHYEVDPARVYVTGVSCGAIGIWDYFATHAGEGVVAASVTISGHGEWALEEAGCELAAMPPMWAFHGAADDVVPVVHIQGPVEQIGACDGADPDGLELTVYPDADHIEPINSTYDLSSSHDIYAWLLEHTSDQ